MREGAAGDGAEVYTACHGVEGGGAVAEERCCEETALVDGCVMAAEAQ